MRGLNHFRWISVVLVFVCASTPVVAQSLLSRANAAYSQGNMAEATQLYELAVQDYILRSGEHHSDTLTIMSKLGSVYREQGRAAEGVALAERVLKLGLESVGERHPDTLIWMIVLASTYSELGRIEDAMKLNERALSASIDVTGQDSEITITAMMSLAANYEVSGFAAKGLPLREKLFNFYKERLGDQHEDTVAAMYSLAKSYLDAGRVNEALILSEDVVRIRLALLGERHELTLNAMSDLAVAYGDLGRLEEELALKERLLSLYTEVLGERNLSTITAMNNLAYVYYKLGRNEDELALNEKALKLRTDLQGERHPDTIAALSNTAMTYRALGRIEEANVLNERVLALRTEIFGEKHSTTITAMGGLALSYLALGRNEAALALSEKALKLSVEVIGEQHPDTLGLLTILAESYAANDRRSYAAALAAHYVAGAEAQRAQPGLAVENRRSIFKAYANGYRNFASLLAQVGDTEESFRLAELSKARTLLENVSTQLAARSGILPDEEQEHLDDLNRQIIAVDGAIAQAPNPESARTLESKRNELASQYGAMQAQLISQYPKYAQVSNVRILGGQELRDLVSTDAVAVSYLNASGSEFIAYVIDETGGTAFINLGALPNVADAIEILRMGQSDNLPLREILGGEGKRAWHLTDGSYQLLDAFLPGPEGAEEAVVYSEIAGYLSAKLLSPLNNWLDGKTHWIISPDGPLAQLTFETLPFGPQRQPAVVSADIHYTQSLSIYALNLSRQKEYELLQGRRSLFAMGNPEYLQPALLDADKRSQLGQEQRRGPNLRRVEQLDDLVDWWRALPGTETEVTEVAKLFPDSPDPYIGPDATEERLQELNSKGELRNYRYLLFSTHGYLSPEQPALSSIVLGLKNRTPEADGYVTASEWPGYDLRSDLIVLSACNSGMGQVVSGEGVMGLPFSLFVAGNVNTILSLWPVDDDATAEFMISLFGKLSAGQSANQALGATKREFINHPRFSHPRFWAPFILLGAG